MTLDLAMVSLTPTARIDTGHIKLLDIKGHNQQSAKGNLQNGDEYSQIAPLVRDYYPGQIKNSHNNNATA